MIRGQDQRSARAGELGPLLANGKDWKDLKALHGQLLRDLEALTGGLGSALRQSSTGSSYAGNSARVFLRRHSGVVLRDLRCSSASSMSSWRA